MESENIAENIAKAGKDVLEARKASVADAAQTFMAVTVVNIALFGIAQDFVCLRCLFELFFRFLVPRISVRLLLHREPAIPLFDLLVRGVSFHA